MNATAHYQRAFAAYLRDPQHNPLPTGVNAQRLNVYAALLFNNVQDFLQRQLPITHALLSEDCWHDVLRQFYAQHACQSPYLRDIAGEFVQWLSPRFTTLPIATLYPYLLELVHFEWVEIALLLDDSAIAWQPTLTPLSADTAYAFNPVLLLQTYQYPVQRISATWQPAQPDTSYVLRVRHTAGHVETIVLNALTAQLLEQLLQGQTLHQALTTLAQQLPILAAEQLNAFGLQLLQQFHTQNVLLSAVQA